MSARTEPPISEEDFRRIRDLRAFEPGAIAAALQSRRIRPAGSATDGLLIVAADHPARGALGIGDDPRAMANRYGLLNRLAKILTRPGVDGVLATPDIIEDLALLGLIEDKVVIGSVNRGGLREASFELDDRATAYDIATIVTSKLDFAKVLLRIDLQDDRTAATLEAVSRCVTAAASARVPIIIEPFMSGRVDGRLVNKLQADDVILSIAIASGLGSSSAYTWLKVPVVPEMDRVMQSTTLPTLLLGGERSRESDNPASWKNALGLPGVRGLVIGRTLLYPDDDDVASAADRLAALAHSS